MTGDAQVIQGNALGLPIADESVDLIITSPPYFALRSYRDEGEHYAGQIGSEPTPKEFLEALWAATREMVRVLKPTGSIWVNLGDKYAGSGGHNNVNLSAKSRASSTLAGKQYSHIIGERAARRNAPDRYNRNKAADATRKQQFGDGGNVASGMGAPPLDYATPPGSISRRDAPDRYNQNADGIRTKSLMGLPWRYAIGCIDDLGLILRAEVVWSKPNGLPESVQDRVRRSHEQWFMFTKEPRYFSATDEIREPHLFPIHAPGNTKWAGERNDGDRMKAAWGDASLGKLPGSVWTIPSEPLLVPEWARTKYNLPDHFAAFSQEWPRRIILGWSPSGICTVCGEGRRPVVDRGGNRKGQTVDPGYKGNPGIPGMSYERSITGYACACTPYTDHAGRGGSRDDGEQVQWSPEGQSARQRQVGGHLGNAPRLGPRREYHLDDWTSPETKPAVVLDPFGGTGTVAMVARALGRTGVSVDLSMDYSRLAKWRIFESGHASKTRTKTNLERQGAFL